MKSYQSFIFDTFRFDARTGKIELNYSLDDEINFTETLLLKTERPTIEIHQEALDRALFALHLIGGVSYYKTCLPKKMEIRSGKLSGEQAKFWNSTYENGLGEFFYRNDINFRGLINFPSALQATSYKLQASQSQTRQAHGKKRVLVPIGGGKDSLVTAELLKKEGHDVMLFRMGHHPIIEELAKIAGLPLLTIERHLSPALFDLNEQGALNGHVPITAYLSFVTIVIALLYDFDAVVMSNERSANEGNIAEFHGMQINHQWSKSLEFEESFRNYVHHFITPAIDYSSALRSMSELEVAKTFATHPEYFHTATSCNKNWKILAKPGHMGASRWCGSCPKCAFVFLLYSAFLPKKTLLEIFGKNLFDDAALQPLYRELLGLEGMKPFECVGTPEESAEAFQLAHARGDLDDTVMMKMLLQTPSR